MFSTSLNPLVFSTGVYPALTVSISTSLPLASCFQSFFSIVKGSSTGAEEITGARKKKRKAPAAEKKKVDDSVWQYPLSYVRLFVTFLMHGMLIVSHNMCVVAYQCSG